MQPSRDISRLVEIMAALRNPDGGCPWDLEQDFSTIKHYTIEEAYEVADTIEREDFDHLCEELGDLLLQPVYHAQMAAEKDLFDFGDVVEAITTKLIRRHPHVFGDEAARTAGMAKGTWERIKAEERQGKAKGKIGDRPPSLLDDVPRPLPALSRAEKLDKRAARAGFDWPNAEAVIAKVREEIDEVAEAAHAADPMKTQEELGDLLFAVASLARHLGVEPEAALTEANIKFTRRFHHIEARCREHGLSVAEAGMERLDAFWNEVRESDKMTRKEG
ncbi:MAG: nucleoside triphosphate pyrophosphohydrolase [Alphaproteobacteria bacterium]|nr:nucleoside triphosphate pyrophosphohydrolase [Alphaproteobacteria bacterium]